MKFKAKKIALLIAGLSFSAMSMAAPVTVAEIDAARIGATIDQAWITGASAPTRTVYEGWVRGCEADTNTIFTTSTSSSSTPGSIGNYSAYVCKRNNRVAVLYHTLDGGSLNAFTPHTIGAVLARIKFVGTGNGCTSTATFTDLVNTANNATVHKGCTLIGGNLPTSGSIAAVSATNATAIATDPDAPSYPVGGFSDVEAALFAPSIGGGSVSSKGVEADVGVGQAFGLAVSVPLYRAMQVAQGITETGTTANDFNPSNAPNITYAQYVSLIALGGENKLSILLPSNTTNSINIQRRVDTSGTQASSNAFFLRNPCAGGVAAALQPTTSSDNVTGQYAVTLNSGSGDVKTRLNTASNSSDDNVKYAIGVLSAENNWRTENSTPGYRYLKIDGVHPETGDTDRARITSTTGDYKFHMEMKSFIRADNLPGKAAKTAFETNIIPAITAQLNNPGANSCAVFPRGLTLIPPNGANCTVGAQVTKVSNQGKNCAAPIAYY